MTQPTPTERAVAVIVARYVVHFPGSVPEIAADDAADWVDALKSDPALLFDLTVEAGGAEQVGWYGPPGARLWDMRSGGPNGLGRDFDKHEPVYRRVEGAGS